MPVDLIDEVELRAALRPHRVDPVAFEAGVRARSQVALKQRAENPLEKLSPFLRSAAAFLPLAILSGCKATPVAGKLAPVGIAYKLLGWLAFPAISLFVLLGAAVFSALQIRSIRGESAAGLDDQRAIDEATRHWWREHRWGAAAMFAVTIALALIGATWLLFLMYIVSFGILTHVLASLARLGLGNRQMIGRSCVLGLALLGQVAGFCGIGNGEIHFVDQSLVVVVLFGGVLSLLVSLFYLSRFERVNLMTGPQWMSAACAATILIPLLLWLSSPVLWSVGPSQIKRYVESFDRAPYHTASWQQWEIPAKWAVDSRLNPDLTRPRRLLDKEISGDQNAYILGTAGRVGLLPVERLKELRNYDLSREYLLTPPPQPLPPLPITYLPAADWIVRAAVLRDDLSPAQRGLLEQRLHTTLDDNLAGPALQLETILRVSQLLDLIGRPIDRDQYRQRVYAAMREFHTTDDGGFQFAGGFKTYRNWPSTAWQKQASSLEPTAYAVELMQIYGIPEGIDLNWVRSFLKPTVLRFSNDKWMAAAIRARLNQLPGVSQPTWLEFFFYERTLLAATVLAGLCLYATLCSPKLKTLAASGQMQL